MLSKLLQVLEQLKRGLTLVLVVAGQEEVLLNKAESVCVSTSLLDVLTLLPLLVKNFFTKLVVLFRICSECSFRGIVDCLRHN